MAKVLSDAQVENAKRDGFVFPVPVMSREKAGEYLSCLEDYEQNHAHRGPRKLMVKPHVLFPWMVELGTTPALLDAIEQLIGPNILLSSSAIWIKNGNDPSFTTWHQDSAYFGLDPHELVTVWLALTDATPEMGCMKVIPGSHRGKAYSHEETFHEKNLLARGQVIHDVDGMDFDYMPLKQGQFSCHHERIVHGSDANDTPVDRIGLGLFFIPTHVKSTIGRRTACLVRGFDEYGYWDEDPVPNDRFDSEIIAHIRAASDRYVDPQYMQEAETDA